MYIRADAVLIMMLENQKYFYSARAGELIKLVCKTFKVGERQAKRYIALAKKEFRKLKKAKLETAFQNAILDREYLVQKYKKEDPKLALDAMKDREKLLDLYPAQSAKVEHKGEVNQKIVFVENLDE